MNYIVMLCSLALMLVSTWLGFSKVSIAFACVFGCALLEIIIEEAVIAAIQKTRIP